MAKRPVGEASVKISVDGVDDVKKGMRDVRAETEDTNRTLNDTVEAADEAINVFRKWAGVLAAATVAAGGLVKTISTIAGGMGSLQKAANDAGNSIRTATDPAQLQGAAENFRKLTQENANFLQRAALISNGAIEGTGTLIDGAAKSLGDFVGLFTDFGRKQAEIFEQTLKGLTAQAAARANILKQQEQSRREDELQNELIKGRISQLEGAARVEAEYVEQRRRRSEQIADAEANARLDELELLRQLEAQDQRIAANRIRSIREQEAAALESLRKQREAEERAAAQFQADQAASDLARALRSLEQAVIEQAKTVNDNRRELERLNQKVTNFTPSLRKGAEGLTRRQRN